MSEPTEALVNRGEYLSGHFVAEVLPKLLRGPDGLGPVWKAREDAGEPTPRSGLRRLNQSYFAARTALAAGAGPARLHGLHADVLTALGFTPEPGKITVESAGRPCHVTVPYADRTDGPRVVAVECGFATEVDAALGGDAAELITPVEPDGAEPIRTGPKLASWLFGADDPPRYVLLLAGGIVILADRAAWPEGRFLAANLDLAMGRRSRPELDLIAGLMSADALLPPESGGDTRLAGFCDASRRHTAGVSKELREGVRRCVEIVAGEVLDRLRDQGVRVADIEEPRKFARELGRESLRYLYRILFLLYAEARPELRILPTDDRDYAAGYSMARLGDLVVPELIDERARRGFHLYESLDLLFRCVNGGHRAQSTAEDEGLRFEALRADLFEPGRTKLIGCLELPDGRTVDTRLREAALHQVLRLLMITKGAKGKRGGFISYAQLGINQLGAVYEGLMSYTGFIADEEMYEVAENGDASKGSWVIPASRVADFDESVMVREVGEDGFATGGFKRYPAGGFVYRLAGRDRQSSASYYTPESLTSVTVELALRQRIEEAGGEVAARDLLNWRICEPALGSGAFLNAAIDQVAAKYLSLRQDELGVRIDADRYETELQKTKAYIALHNSYGVDLNDTAVELAEVSIWLNVMHPGLRAPWFGLHLKRGNSLVGCGRRVYPSSALAKKAWLTQAPERRPLSEGEVGDDTIHHFLLPAYGWGAVAGEKEAKTLAPQQTKRLGDWRKRIRSTPTATQAKRLRGLARRAEFCWDLVRQRLALSERDVSRAIDVWGADLDHPGHAVDRERILADLTSPGTPYWRLKTLMDAWCALWFWPVDAVGLLDGLDDAYAADVRIAIVDTTEPEPRPDADDGTDDDLPVVAVQTTLYGDEPEQMSFSVRTRSYGHKPTAAVGHTRKPTALNKLDDWLDFAEALLGTHDVPPGSLITTFDDLDRLTEYEESLPAWTGMEPEPYAIDARFPWLKEVRAQTDRHGFFHWELDFAQVFAKGGFDLQVGNPPWVRLDWEDDVVLAELDPWFALADKPPPDVKRDRRSSLLNKPSSRGFFLDELAANAGMVQNLGARTEYPLLDGTRPDLYRAFMCQVWDHLGPHGAAGLIHPDTHLGGVKEGALRVATFRHMRFHAHFSNRRGIFPDIHANTEFGIHVYGAERKIRFIHMSWLFDPVTLVESLTHDGTGPTPGIKYQGTWETRPHRSRLLAVDLPLLEQWWRLSGSAESSTDQTPLLYPVTTAENDAIKALAGWNRHLADESTWLSQGYNETNAKRDGFIRWGTGQPADWPEAVLQGPHLGIGTPSAKQPNDPCRTNRDWSAFDLTALPADAIPRTNYARACDLDRFRAAQDVWDGRRYTEYYRLAWRRMIPFDTERSLFAALLAPGPAHVDAVNSMVLTNHRATALSAGFWSSLPLDYLLRITGRADLRLAEVRKMPAPEPDHPLALALLLRTLRLNCLTNAYADLWAELYEPTWHDETWAVNWSHVAPLNHGLTLEWGMGTPLRTEAERRAALVEIDALVSVWLGIDIDGLISIYRSRYPVLSDYEAKIWFDANGRKIAANHNTYGYGQTKDDYLQLVEHLENGGAAPEGYAPPFTKADREAEYRQAHAVFTARAAEGR